MEAYLDNSATTKCLEEVKDIVVKTMTQDFGNPSAKHLIGVYAERYLREAREAIGKILKVTEKEIFFTSGGTEADNWAIIGTALANQRMGKHIITSSVEHAAVLEPMRYLESLGFSVTYLDVDRYGRVNLEQLRQAMTKETILVSVMYVNNEVGALEPISEIAHIVKEKNPSALFHVDAIQAYGKYRIYPKKTGIDLLSVSGHKIHGPKGIGFLYINEKVKIKPLILGGGQQKGMRSGTDNVPGAAGLGVAAKMAYESYEEKWNHLLSLKKSFMEQVGQIENVTFNSLPGEEGAPHIVSVSFEGVRSEVLLHALEERGIYVSAGSACSSNKKQTASHTLLALHMPRQLLDCTLRFSFCEMTTMEEIAYSAQTLCQLVPALRRYARH
ncbi:MAG: cysteine desulfurase family protein [Lachnospiraceae bacterium]|nr:cysteine desulfurase family protein [Lachnospiraceae bacterium]